MALKIGINGFGRIGKLVFRSAVEQGGIEIVGINDLMTSAQVAHALKYDSTQGPFSGDIAFDDSSLTVNGKKVRISAIKDPAELKWGDVGAEIVVESTGIFRASADCKKHLAAGAKKVLLSVPPKDQGEVKLIVLGVNDKTLTADDKLVSNASCTTNCLAPPAKVIHQAFGIEKGLMTTIHAYTNDQRTLDQVHTDPRRARAAAVSMIPTTTGAARAVGKVLPELDGKLDGMSIRVPTPTGSCVDLVALLSKKTTAEEVNAALKKASEGELKGILAYTEDPIVSVDIVHNPASSIVDAPCTTVIDGNLLKLIAWYDNEWGYSCRCIDLMKKMAG
jgi:glyceraldehyde 3-phosphate dehydrogenase